MAGRLQNDLTVRKIQIYTSKIPKVIFYDTVYNQIIFGTFECVAFILFYITSEIVIAIIAFLIRPTFKQTFFLRKIITDYDIIV